jgi:hypothetical protein
MEQKILQEQVVELTDGLIDLEQAGLLIKKIHVAYDHPTQWMACFPGINTGHNQGLSKHQLISVWKLVERAIQQDAELLSGPDKKVVPAINISARIQGYILFNASMDFEISKRMQKTES